MVEPGERFEGFRATGCGDTRLELALLAGGRATLAFHSGWMGDARPLDVLLELRHAPESDCYGLLVLDAARLA